MKKKNGVHSVFMLRPKSFGYNVSTKSTNPFQNNVQFDQKYIANKAIEEFDEMVELLDDQEINVHVFEDDQMLNLPDAVFINNWLAVTPERNLYLFPMESKLRRGERRNRIIEELREKLMINNAIDLSHFEASDKYLESTGSMVFDYENQIAFASISKRTDTTLFDEFCASIGYKGFSFNTSDLEGQPIYHTNILLSIASAYVIICMDCIDNAIERAMIKKALGQSQKAIIDITFNQMMSFAGNCLEVFDKNNKSKLVMSRTGYSSLRSDQIETISKYSEIVVVNVSIIERVGGGSARCMMLGVPY